MNNKEVDIELKTPVFICVISYTQTCEIDGITIAGKNKESLKFTPAADSEFLYYGRCKCISGVPVTPDGKPSPVLITKSALDLAKIPKYVVDAGTIIKPDIPYYTVNISSGKNIKYYNSLDIKDVKRAFSFGKMIGEQFGKTNDSVIIGECVPGGTTTALGVLLSMGIDAKYKISSSMPNNPHKLKNEIVEDCMIRNKIYFGDLKDQPFKAMSIFGDPSVPTISGIVKGAYESGARIMLAGGTQICASLATLKSLNMNLDKISIGTTSYVVNDKKSDIVGIVENINDEINILSINLNLEESSKNGLKSFARGFVKEGVGAGGCSIASMLKTNYSIDKKTLLKSIEMGYEKYIEPHLGFT
ncbi:MAG: nicotinate mononucleotide-dependent phosphoribosyltransferase CobT [Nitrososphaeraceae archaeon]